MSLQDRKRELEFAASPHTASWRESRGYVIATVSGLTTEQAKRVRYRFQGEGWAASCKKNYTEVRAERKIDK